MKVWVVFDTEPRGVFDTEDAAKALAFDITNEPEPSSAPVKVTEIELRSSKGEHVHSPEAWCFYCSQSAPQGCAEHMRMYRFRCASCGNDVPGNIQFLG